MNEQVLRQAGFSELSCQFARFIAGIDDSDDPLIAITASLVSEAVADGHVCLDIKQAFREGYDLPQASTEWLQRLKKSRVVGEEGEFTPLILTNDGLLYLYRYWLDEQIVAKAIRLRCQPIEINDAKQLADDFKQWPTTIDDIDWQKIAVLTAITRQFSVISGGPGTGKTTIVRRLLQLLRGQSPHLTIALAAPTGKAATRLQQAINEDGVQPFLTAKTLHRLLGISFDNEQGRYNRKRPLAIDVLIIDEASMVDISLMAKLMQALPDKARLILLGDSQQLASVESGAVLANLCAHTPQFSAAFIEQAKTYTDIELNNEITQSSLLSDSMVLLKTSYRFDEHSDIGRLAKAIQAADIGQVHQIINNAAEPLWQQSLNTEDIQQQVLSGYHAYFDAVKSHAEPALCLQQFMDFRVLAALKNGPQSVRSVNDLIEKRLKAIGWKVQQTFYYGRPIMITKNDYRQNLFNGDIGLILVDAEGHLKACFLSEDNAVRWVELSRLPAHETAFAMTIHKSQGSEFDRVAVLLPEEESPLLNRELLYTAISRAKKQLLIIASDAILTKTIMSQHQRESGLSQLLHNNE